MNNLNVCFTGYTCAPESQKVYIVKNGKRHIFVAANMPPNGWLNMPEDIRVKTFRELNFKKSRQGRYAVLTFNTPIGVKVYQGYVPSYKKLLEVIYKLKKKHNLEGTVLTVKTKYIG